ncbi:chaperone protein dnaJ 11, chloroplastic [Mercurialis annua]|uniref:chaperone protein dnaJ 11, chloroplastic n=1 Tax=Mercurialis annua TaxID=3986 RepID=UPI002160C240|nr:chaperone protein dnaJ 11, chloroplastic [Mercurialis annua]
MFTSSPPLTLTLPLSATVKPLLTSLKPSLPATARSRRRLTITAASVSTFLEPPLPIGKTMSLYEMLRVNKTASQMEIKTAYRSLAKLYHPDAIVHYDEEVRSDGHDFMEIHNAYETLSDPAARALYDLSLEASALRRRRFTDGYYPTRRWETDQCW